MQPVSCKLAAPHKKRLRDAPQNAKNTIMNRYPGIHDGARFSSAFEIVLYKQLTSIRSRHIRPLSGIFFNSHAFSALVVSYLQSTLQIPNW